MTNLRSLAVNSSIAYIGTFAIIGLGVVSKMLLARLLSAAELGIFFIAQTLFSMLVFFSSLGMTDTIARFVGLYFKLDLSKSLEVLSRGLRLVLSFSVFIAVLVALSASSIADHFIHDPRFSTVAVILALAIPFKLGADLIGSANQGAGRLYFKIMMVDLVPAILFSGGLGLLLAFKGGSLNIVVALYVIPFAVSLFLFRGLFRFTAIFSGRGSSVTTRDLMRYSVPLLLSGIVAWPLSLVPAVIGSLTSVDAVAYYSLAISMASFIYLGASVTEAAGLSVWSSYLGSSDTNRLKEDYRLTTRWAVVIGSLVFVPLLICPYEIVVLLFGLKYKPVAQILPIMSCIFFANLITGPTESILKAYGDTRFIFMTRLTVGIVVALTLYPALTFWGLNGAIGVYGLSVAVGGIGMYSWQLYKQHHLHPIDKHFLLILASIGSAIFLTFLFVQNVPHLSGSIVTIIGTVLVYFLFLVSHFIVLKAVTPRDRRIISQVFSRICMLLQAKYAKY